MQHLNNDQPQPAVGSSLSTVAPELSLSARQMLPKTTMQKERQQQMMLVRSAETAWPPAAVGRDETGNVIPNKDLASYNSNATIVARSRLSYKLQKLLPVFPPAVSQPHFAKWKISRWVVLAAYCLYSLIAGPSFLNWTTIADMLYRADAFLWRCTTTSLLLQQQQHVPLPHEAKCAEQELEVDNLFGVASCSYFMFAMLGGIMLDFAGPKIGALAGLFSLILGWLLFAFSSQHFQAYVPAMIFVGAGIDMTFFPCLCGANLFPQWSGTIIAILGSFRSISFIVGVLMRLSYFNIGHAKFGSVLCGFVGFGLGFCVLVAIFIIPWKAWPPPQMVIGSGAANSEEGVLADTAAALRKQKTSDVTAGGLNTNKRNVCSGATSQVMAKIGKQTVLQDTQNGEKSAEKDDELLSVESGNVAAVCTQVSEEEAVKLQPLQISSFKDSSAKMELEYNKIKRSGKERCKAAAISLRRDFLSLSFLPVVPYFVFVLIDVLFFTPSTKRLIPHAYEANQIITIFGFVPCIIFGYLCDHIGIVKVMMICNGSGLLAWILLLIPSIPCYIILQYVVSVLFTVQMSFLLSQIYCYVTEYCAAENLGTLVGFLASGGGVMSLVTSPMRSYSLEHSFYAMVGLSLGLAAVNQGLLIFLYIWHTKLAPRVAQADMQPIYSA